jgi:hypothetical protein
MSDTFSFEDAQSPAPAPDQDQTGSITQPNTFSFEDAQAPAQASQPSTFSFEDAQKPAAPEVSTSGAAAVGAVKGIVPTIGAIVGGAAGAGLGSTVGPVGTVGGAVAGSLAGSALATEGQQWFMDKLGLDQGDGFLSNAYETAAQNQHQLANVAGSMVPMLAGFGPGSASRMARVISAAIMGSGQAAQEYVNTGNVSVPDVLLTAGAGALLPNPRAWTQTTMEAGEQLGRVLSGRNATTPRVVGGGVNPQQNPDAAGRPDIQSDPYAVSTKEAATVDANVPVNTSRGVAEEKPAVPGANIKPPEPGQSVTTDAATIAVNRSANLYGKDTTPATREGITNAVSTPEVQTDPIDKTVEAAITDQLGSRPVQTTGESVQAPVPTPTPTPAQPQPVGQPSQPIAAPHIQAGMGAGATLGSPNGPGQEASARPLTVNTITDAVRASILRAQGRPIVADHPIVSGAISSKDPNGPVYVDPSVPTEYRPFVRIHETVEDGLEALGMKYPQAHEIATEAEKTTVENAGVDYAKYSKWWDDHLPVIGKQNVDPRFYDTLGLASDPFADIGKHRFGDVDFSTGANAPAPESGKLSNEAKLDEKAVLTRLRGKGYNDVADMLEKMPDEDRARGISYANEMYPEEAPKAAAPETVPTGKTTIEINGKKAELENAKPFSILAKVKEMMGDTSGGGPLPGKGNRANDPLAIERNKSAQAYGDSLPALFQTRRARADNIDTFIRTHMNPLEKLTTAERTQLHDADENNTIKSLPQNLQDAYEKSIAPLKAAYYEALDGAKALGAQDIPNLYKGLTKSFVPRIAKGTLEPLPETNDAMVRLRSLTDYSPSLEERKLFSADDGAGTRLTVEPRDNNTMTIWRNGKGTNTQTPVGFKGKAGDTLPLFGKQFTLDHATTDELTRDVKGVDGKPLQWEKDPIVWANALRNVKGVYDNLRLAQDISESDGFKNNTTTKIDEARARGYNLNPTSLKTLATDSKTGKQIYMPNAIKWPLDDFAHAGFNSDALEKANQAASALIKTMYTFGSPIHALNVLDTAIIGRGFDWLNPKAYKTMVTTGLQAIKSVSDPNDALYSVLANHGTGLLSRNVLNSDLISNLAKQAGIQMKKNPSMWDPIAKGLGIDVPALGKSMYDYSRLHMWQMSDMLIVQRVLENMKLHGLNLDDAIAATHQTIPNYQIGSTLLGSRLMAQMARTPALSLFGLYHGGLWRSYGQMISHAVAGDTPAKRNAAIGQLMMLGVMGYAVYPMLDKFAQYVTGNDKATFGRRGLSAIPGNMYDFLNGEKTGKDYVQTAQNIFTPSLLAQASIHLLGNKDWTGKDILPPRNYYQPGTAIRGALRVGNEAAKSLVPPYGTIADAAQMAARQGGGAGTVAKKFIERNVGINEPSQASQNWLARLPITSASDEIKRRQNAGPFERVYNALTNNQ